ncbi:TetR/AcrR family transcriptional regulator [Streptomyces sp. NBC_01754]|uniref:acyl-CoA-like ligand-binding transcription factor n=1 Tax=Streptomyces sp. NBC_01754 TaxID=2975930 RepID=UPI002DDA9781|nr:TetR family transcriptional regulator [Streptomyces sp. NBC_01754]WSC96257.1 TetR/AcrR family transcriptional regulator [Streptomyces sp. NBC_01754]
MSADDPSLGLRERKKRATRDVLADAALRSAAERGFENVTVEAVTGEVGVSVRTFFNYFPCLEDAITRPDRGCAARLRQAVLDAPEELPALDALREALGRELADIEEDQERWELQTAALTKSPSLLPGFLAAQGADERAMVAVLAQRLGQNPESDLYPRLLAHASVAAVRPPNSGWRPDEPVRSKASTARRPPRWPPV